MALEDFELGGQVVAQAFEDFQFAEPAGIGAT
jgi:hypothetical protein